MGSHYHYPLKDTDVNREIIHRGLEPKFEYKSNFPCVDTTKVLSKSAAVYPDTNVDTSAKPISSMNQVSNQSSVNDSDATLSTSIQTTYRLHTTVNDETAGAISIVYSYGARPDRQIQRKGVSKKSLASKVITQKSNEANAEQDSKLLQGEPRSCPTLREVRRFQITMYMKNSRGQSLNKQCSKFNQRLL